MALAHVRQIGRRGIGSCSVGAVPMRLVAQSRFSPR
jgi:hypothetical protein